jgi:hypothetical protein
VTAEDLLHEIQSAGIRLVLTDRGTIKAAGDDATLDKWTPVMRSRKPELIDLLRLWAELESAVQACCDARGDDEKNRLALLADCRQEPADKWSWFIWYFQEEVAQWTH